VLERQRIGRGKSGEEERKREREKRVVSPAREHASYDCS